jgi:hypothetical protein
MRALMVPVILALSVAPADGGELRPHGIVSRLDTSEWVGDFFADAERSITIFLWDRTTLQLDGLLTIGLLDPDRVAAGAMENAQFSVRIPDRDIYVNNQIEFMLGPEGALPPDQAGPDDCVLVLRLDWNVNWIDVTERGTCMAPFAGRYEYRPLDQDD